MIADTDIHNAARSHNEIEPSEAIRVPDERWILGWIGLTTLVIPAALVLMAPFAAITMLIFNWAVEAGFLPGYDPGLVDGIGFFIGLSLVMAAAQWWLLRNHLPNARSWFLATGAGFLIGGLLVLAILSLLSAFTVGTTWIIAIYMIPVGFAVGLTQWLVLHRLLSNAFWIVIIDIAAVCSTLLAGRSITSIPELLLILILPGAITGLGLWFLMKKSQPREGVVKLETTDAVEKRPMPKIWIGLGLVALIPTFFLCIWIYAASQLALAKNEGIYPTVEEAVIQRNSQGWGGAQVVGIEDVRASVNQHDGSQPHVWFGGARVFLDRAPQGWDRTEFSSGSYYVHVEDGWVLVPEGAFPEFIGWVMELYNMEGVDEWISENR